MGGGAVLARRAIQSIIVLMLLVTTLFFLSRMSGDPVTMLTEGAIEPEDVEALREAYGFNDPILVQYGRFLGEISRGDFGDSIRTFQPARSLVIDRIKVSLQLVIPAFILVILIAIPLGSIAAVKRGAIGAFAMVMAVIFQSVPSFFLGVLYIFLFGVTLRWLPVFGTGGIDHYILPVATLMGYDLARYTRLMRAQVSESLSQEYVRTARAKGLAETSVIRKHVLRNALLPIITVMGIDIGTLVGSAIIVEAIFAWPGFGTLVVEAAKTRDYPVIQAAGFTIGLLVLAGSLLSDYAYGLIDPRIRRSNN
jgi:peptide/nickel transport system permease protein